MWTGTIALGERLPTEAWEEAQGIKDEYRLLQNATWGPRGRWNINSMGAKPPVSCANSNFCIHRNRKLHSPGRGRERGLYLSRGIKWNDEIYWCLYCSFSRLSNLCISPDRAFDSTVVVGYSNTELCAKVHAWLSYPFLISLIRWFFYLPACELGDFRKLVTLFCSMQMCCKQSILLAAVPFERRRLIYKHLKEWNWKNVLSTGSIKSAFNFRNTILIFTLKCCCRWEYEIFFKY